MKTSRLLPMIVCLVVVIGFLSRTHAAAPVSAAPESRFADVTDSGLVIVPASGGTTGSYTGSYDPCPTPIEGGWDAYGRILYGNYANRRVAGNGYSFCVTNNTSNVFFVPMGSAGETGAFYTAAPSLNISRF